MALFGKKEKKETKLKASATLASKPVLQKEGALDAGLILLRPHLSEKSLLKGEHHVYVFEVARDATKHAVSQAVAAAYRKEPVKIRIVNMPGKSVSLRIKGSGGRKGRMKKAYVYLKKGDTLQLI
jgi:large subunit ribosomal protein L23